MGRNDRSFYFLPKDIQTYLVEKRQKCQCFKLIPWHRKGFLAMERALGYLAPDAGGTSWKVLVVYLCSGLVGHRNDLRLRWSPTAYILSGW